MYAHGVVDKLPVIVWMKSTENIMLSYNQKANSICKYADVNPKSFFWLELT